MRWARTVALAALAVLAVVEVGSGAPDQLAQGRRLYQVGSYPSCGLCHALRSAAATSPFADDLDGGLLEDTRGKSTRAVERFVLGFIRNGACYDPHDAAR